MPLNVLILLYHAVNKISFQQASESVWYEMQKVLQLKTGFLSLCLAMPGPPVGSSCPGACQELWERVAEEGQQQH